MTPAEQLRAEQRDRQKDLFHALGMDRHRKESDRIARACAAMDLVLSGRYTRAMAQTKGSIFGPLEEISMVSLILDYEQATSPKEREQLEAKMVALDVMLESLPDGSQWWVRLVQGDPGLETSLERAEAYLAAKGT